MNPLAVVIPVYNGREFLLEAVASVVNQTRPVDEIWVVDDGSTDGSADLLANRGDRVRVLRKTNGGVASARNA
ncbi:MAG TPA: glycosyltransferase family 2 protein, partial [Elusimicrobiota bacterium]|nr:glycosyltransferase family 2 protein [Elusimicrobiota bacterium]